MAETLDQKLAKIERGEAAILNMFHAFMKPNAPLYVGDLVLHGIGKRALALSSGFRGLIVARNSTCAAALLRMQLDTALRLYAARLLDDPASYANTIFKGQRISEIKDRDGQRLTDSYLARRMSDQYPWVQNVYRQTSEFVHFTNRHIFAAVSAVDDEKYNAHLQLSAKDPERPESDYFELVHAFAHTTQLVATFAAEWHSAIHPDRKFMVVEQANEATVAS